MRRIRLLPGLVAMGAMLVGGAWLGGRFSRRLRRKTWSDRPGRSPQRPMRVTDFDEVDAVIGGTRCWCGGVLEPLATGSQMDTEGSTRIARSRCRGCGAEHELYFDLREVRH